MLDIDDREWHLIAGALDVQEHSCRLRGAPDQAGKFAALLAKIGPHGETAWRDGVTSRQARELRLALDD